MPDAMRAMLVQQVEEAKERLQLYDLAQTPLPHEYGCPCPRGICILLWAVAHPMRPIELPEVEWLKELDEMEL